MLQIERYASFNCLICLYPAYLDIDITKITVPISCLNLLRRDICAYVRHLKLRALYQDDGLFIAPTASLTGNVRRLSFGTGCTIGQYSSIDITDESTSRKPNACVSLGKYVYIGESCNIRAAGTHIRIGKNTMIANGVSIIGSNHRTKGGTPMRLQPWDMNKSGVSIGEDCWIGAGAIVLPGCVIGDGVVVAAGAVAGGRIPAQSIVGGVPARLIRMRK